MTKRKVLAAATLAALPLLTASAAPGVRTGLVDQIGPPRDHLASGGARWAYAFGMEGEEALLFTMAGAVGCSLFGPVGGAACSITGAL